MRRFFAVFLAVLLLISSVIPAYAAAPYDADWVPPVPDFITQIENGFQAAGLGINGSAQYQEVIDWFEDVLGDPNAVVLFLLDQGVYNRYNEENGIDYDRQFSIYMVAPDKKANGSRYDLGVFEHRGGPCHQQQMNTPSPMSYMCLNSPHSFAKFIYDVKTGKLVMQPSLSHLPGGSGSVIRFTYVLAAGNFDSIINPEPLRFVNGPFTEPSDVYPGFTQVCGKDFGVGTIYHQVVDGKAVEHWRDYDWWLGIDGGEIPPYNQNLDLDQDTDGDGKPDVNVRPGEGSSSGSGGSDTGDGGDSGGGSSSSGGDSGGGSSFDKGSPPDTWLEKDDQDLTYDPWKFFDPFQFKYDSFSWDKNYDPLKGYQPGRMPEFPKAGNPNYGAKDPFDVPNDIKFKDFVIQFEKGKGD